MSRLNPVCRIAADSDAALVRLLSGWIALGAVISVLLPAQAAYSHYIGWLSYWLLVAPLVSLAVLRRNRLAAALSAFLVRGWRRRKPSARRGAARRAGAVGFRNRPALALATALIGR